MVAIKAVRWIFTESVGISMIVGTTEVKVEQVEKVSHSVSEFISFAESLVPEEFRQCKAIVDNQKYICCLILRKSKLLDWDKKNRIIEEVLKDTRVMGNANELVSITKIYSLIDREVVSEYLRRGDEIERKLRK